MNPSIAGFESIHHRDIKSPNILLDGHLNAKITDFGLARAVETSSEYLTTKCGTRAYMSPEVLEEEPELTREVLIPLSRRRLGTKFALRP